MANISFENLAAKKIYYTSLKNTKSKSGKTRVKELFKIKSLSDDNDALSYNEAIAAKRALDLHDSWSIHSLGIVTYNDKEVNKAYSSNKVVRCLEKLKSVDVPKETKIRAIQFLLNEGASETQIVSFLKTLGQIASPYTSYVYKSMQGLFKGLKKLGWNNKEIISFLVGLARGVGQGISNAMDNTLKSITNFRKLGWQDNKIKDTLLEMAELCKSGTGSAFEVFFSTLMGLRGLGWREDVAVRFLLNVAKARRGATGPSFESIPKTVLKLKKRGWSDYEIENFITDLAHTAKHNFVRALKKLPSTYQSMLGVFGKQDFVKKLLKGFVKKAGEATGRTFDICRKITSKNKILSFYNKFDTKKPFIYIVFYDLALELKGLGVRERRISSYFKELRRTPKGVFSAFQFLMRAKAVLKKPFVEEILANPGLRVDQLFIQLKNCELALELKGLGVRERRISSYFKELRKAPKQVFLVFQSLMRAKAALNKPSLVEEILANSGPQADQFFDQLTARLKRGEKPSTIMKDFRTRWKLKITWLSRLSPRVLPKVIQNRTNYKPSGKRAVVFWIAYSDHNHAFSSPRLLNAFDRHNHDIFYFEIENEQQKAAYKRYLARHNITPSVTITIGHGDGKNLYYYNDGHDRHKYSKGDFLKERRNARLKNCGISIISACFVNKSGLAEMEAKVYPQARTIYATTGGIIPKFGPQNPDGSYDLLEIKEVGGIYPLHPNPNCSKISK